MLTNSRAAEALPSVDTIPARRWIRLGVAHLILGALASWYSPHADPYAWWAHGLWCFAGLALAIPMLLRAFLGNFEVVWTDHRVVFLAIFSLFFQFGAALLAVGPERQIEGVLGHYLIDARDALRLDGINGIGFGLAILTASRARGRWLGAQADRVAVVAARVPRTWVAASALILGTAATFYSLQFELGLVSGSPSGILVQLKNLVFVGIIIAVSGRGPHEHVLRLLGVAVAAFLAFVGALTFMKVGALMPLAVLAAGLAWRFGSRRVLPAAVVVLVSTFALLGSVSAYGRTLVYFAPNESTLTDRWSFLQEGWMLSRDQTEDEEYAWWGRLCNVHTEVAALDFQDAGDGGHGLAVAWWLLVPRFLAPQKPVMTFGDELYFKITGWDGSNDAMGIFASGYYHGGWWGFVLASVSCGWILAQTSAIARAIQNRQAMLLLPFSFLGLTIASEVAGDFISSYWGAFIFVLYPILAASFVLFVLGGSRLVRGTRRADLLTDAAPQAQE